MAEKKFSAGGVARLLPFPAAPGEAFVVRGRQVSGCLEATLTRDTVRHHIFGRDRYEPVELLALRRFPRGERRAYSRYLGHIEDAARIAVRDELGYRVSTVAERDRLTLRLVARLLRPDGTILTEICHEQVFEDPDSQNTLIDAHERAEELRGRARDLNDQFLDERDHHLSELRAVYAEDDRRAEAAGELRRSIDGYAG